MTARHLELIQIARGCDTHRCSNLTNLDNVFYFGTFSIQGDKVPDGTFLDMTNFCKGYVWINSINIGRYWTPKGPQLTLFVPGEYLVKGENNIVVMEIDGSGKEGNGVEFVREARWLGIGEGNKGAATSVGSSGEASPQTAVVETATDDGMSDLARLVLQYIGAQL